jgi:hypothetical protein
MWYTILVAAAGLQERGDAPRPAMSRPPLQSTQHAVNSNSSSNCSDEQCEPVLVTFVNAHGESTGTIRLQQLFAKLRQCFHMVMRQ